MNKKWNNPMSSRCLNVVLSFKGDAEKFHPVFYKCISNAKNPFVASLNKYAS